MKSSSSMCIITSLLLSYLVTLSTCIPAKNPSASIRAPERNNRNTCNNFKLKTEEALKQLLKQNPTQPCIGRYVKTKDPSRTPEMIPRIICPKDSRNQCVQIELPMTVSVKTPKGKHVLTNILVPSGCFEAKYHT